MKRSVNDFIYKFDIGNPNWGRNALVALRLEGEPAPSSFVLRYSKSRVRWFRIQLGFWRKVVVHGHSHSVTQFENSCADYGLASL